MESNRELKERFPEDTLVCTPCGCTWKVLGSTVGDHTLKLQLWLQPVHGEECEAHVCERTNTYMHAYKCMLRDQYPDGDPPLTAIQQHLVDLFHAAHARQCAFMQGDVERYDRQLTHVLSDVKYFMERNGLWGADPTERE
jgi:hypothetical protein